MTQATRVYSTPPINTPTTQQRFAVEIDRRRFLSNAAGIAAAGTVLALAIPAAPAAADAPRTLSANPDSVFGLIEAHKMADAAHDAALAEQNRLELIGDPDADWVTEAPCHSAMASFNDLIETAPVTFAGLVAWSSYLDEIDPWMFEERGPTLVATLAEALGNLAVQS
jgi:hypothetical protein